MPDEAVLRIDIDEGNYPPVGPPLGAAPPVMAPPLPSLGGAPMLLPPTPPPDLLSKLEILAKDLGLLHAALDPEVIRLNVFAEQELAAARQRVADATQAERDALLVGPPKPIDLAWRNQLAELEKALDPNNVSRLVREEDALVLARQKLADATAAERERLGYDLEHVFRVQRLRDSLDPDRLRRAASKEIEREDAEARARLGLKREKERLAPEAREVMGPIDSLARVADSMRGTLGGLTGVGGGIALDFLKVLSEAKKKEAQGGPGVAQSLGGLVSGGMTAEMAATAVPVVGLAVAGLMAAKKAADDDREGWLRFERGMADAVGNTTKALGVFSAELVSADANPANYVRLFGAAIDATSTKFLDFSETVDKVVSSISPTGAYLIDLANNTIGGFGKALGGATEAVGAFMNAMDANVQRYAGFAPGLAQAQAQAGVVQVMNDIRRAQEVAPALTRYVQARLELQQRFEDAKVRFINEITPLAVRGMGLLEKMLPALEFVVSVVTAIANHIPGLADDVKGISNNLSTPQPGQGNVIPTDFLMRGQNPLGGTNPFDFGAAGPAQVVRR